VVPRGTAQGGGGGAIPGLQVLESSSLAEALVAALGVHPAEAWQD
jgi:hypothetical protein